MRQVEIAISGDLAKGVRCKLRKLRTSEKEVSLFRLSLKSASPHVPKPLVLKFSFEKADALGRWTSGSQLKSIPPEWTAPLETELPRQMPVVCFFAQDGGNRGAFAVSEVKRTLKISAGAEEEAGRLSCKIEFFASPEAPLSEFNALLRIDQRRVPYSEVLQSFSSWFETLPDCKPVSAPVSALEPLYSSWYSYHQDLFAEEIERECKLAKANGMTAIIVDDGWQTDDNNKGYAFCGDWEPSVKRYPEGMRAHVARIHKAGLRYLLWYSVPFIGFKSKNFKRFEGKFLASLPNLGACVLDPRFPEVRTWLVDLYEKAARDWDLDGFKLDFIDRFKFEGEDPALKDNYAGRDFKTVPAAVDELLSSVLRKLRKIKAAMMIEFRQPYIGPSMRKYGTMFRAGDCPADALFNRVRTIDLRLASGGTPVHSDMLIWSPEDSAENAAAQLLNVLFSVPQISVREAKLPKRHREMLRFWLKFWLNNRDTLMHGQFKPEQPHMNYPLVYAEGGHGVIAALYSQGHVAEVRKTRGKTFQLVNATGAAEVMVNVKSRSALAAKLFDAVGHAVGTLSLAPGLQVVKMPVSGLLTVSK